MSVLLAWHNQIENATLTSDATFVSTLPLANLKSYLLPKVARTTTNDPFTITATFAAAISVGCIFIVNHNLARLSTVQIKCYKDDLLVDDSDVMVVYPKVSGYVAQSEMIATLRRDFAYYLPQNTSIDKVDVIFTPANSSYVQIGRLFISECYEPSGGVDYGDQPISYRDLSEVKTTARGIRYAYQQQKLRSVDLTLKYLPESEIFNSIFDAQRRLGVTGEIVYSHTGRPTLSSVPQGLAQSPEVYAQCFMANFVELNPLNQAFYRGYNTVLKLLEVAT